MKKRNVIILTTLLIVGLASATLAWGGQGGWGRGQGCGATCSGGDFAGAAGLNLTADQTEKLQTLRQTMQQETKPLRDKMFAARGDLRLLWADKNPNQDKIVAAQKEMRSLRDQMQDKMTAYRLAALNVLTPEQKAKIQSYRGRGFGGGKGKGFGSGRGGCGGGGPRGNW